MSLAFSYWLVRQKIFQDHFVFFLPGPVFSSARRTGSPYSLLIGVSTGTTGMEISEEGSQQIKSRTTI